MLHKYMHSLYSLNKFVAFTATVKKSPKIYGLGNRKQNKSTRDGNGKTTEFISMSEMRELQMNTQMHEIHILFNHPQFLLPKCIIIISYVFENSIYTLRILEEVKINASDM